MIDLTDRKNIFYWQTDRILSPEDYARIFLKRHDVPEKELVNVLTRGITSISGQKRIIIEPADENVLKGNVNIVRKVMINGKKYVVRIHPRDVKNGYYFVEKIALDRAKEEGVPTPKVLEIHLASHEKDMDFMLTTVSSGITMDVFLQKNASNENTLLFDAGVNMAKIHQVKVKRFGAFDNDIAKKSGILAGLHPTYRDFILTGLDENLERLVRFRIVSQPRAKAMKNVFGVRNFEPIDGPRLIHNDFADWNLLTDGSVLTGVLDWDECHGGDPIADLACWSTFYNIERMEQFLKGYTSIATLPKDYDDRFHYYRLRYTISKMALRAKRYQVDQSAFIKEKLQVGKRALAEELRYFHLVH